MQRVFTGLILAAIGIIVIHAIVASRSETVPLRFSVKDIPEQGLIMVGRSHPDFEGLRSMLPSAGLLPDQSTQPYVFIKNLGNTRAVAYSIKWELLKDDGRVTAKTRTYSREDILMGKEAPEDPTDRIILKPNKARLFSLFGYGDGQEVPLTPGGKSGRGSNPEIVQKLSRAGILAGANDELSHTISVTVSLDGVFFEDGTFVGPNTTNFFERIRMQTEAKEIMVREILRRLNDGATPAEVMQYLKTTAETLNGSEMTPSSDAKASEIYNYHAKRFLDDALGIRAAARDDELAVRRILQYNKPTHRLSLRKLN